MISNSEYYIVKQDNYKVFGTGSFGCRELYTVRPFKPNEDIYIWKSGYILSSSTAHLKKAALKFFPSVPFTKIKLGDLIYAMTGESPSTIVLVKYKCYMYDIRNWVDRGCYAFNWHLGDGLENVEEFIFYIVRREDAVLCKKTPKELRYKEDTKKKKEQESLARLVFKDNIIAKLAENGLKVSEKYTNVMCAEDNLTWNTLLQTSLEYYLNNIVFKDLGCKLKYSAPAKTNSMKINTGIFKLDEIHPDINEGVNNENK